MSEQISVTIPEIHTIPPEDRDTAASCDLALEPGTGEWCEVGEAEHGQGAAGLAKVRLQRSHAIRDSTSPPPPSHGASQGTQTPHTPLTMSEGGSERSTGSELGDVGEMGPGGDTVSVTDSGRGDTDTPDGEVYTDNTGTDLTQFIITTLNKNAKDRVLMLKLEQEMSNLVKDSKKTHHKFPHMSSYHRMMVHRVAAYFGLDHNVDQSGNCVIVNKTKNTRLPDLKFKDHTVEDTLASASDNPLPMKLKLMKRESCSCDSGDRLSDTNSRRSKSIEEREEEYEKAKRRIFNDMNKDHKTNHERPHTDQRLTCLASTKATSQARSFDIRESLTGPTDRPAVSKSFSFGGYPAPQHLEPRRQAAPSPSQYTPAHRPSPPAIVKGQVVWAVSDVSCVPSGSVLINPDNGTPYLNSDGSVYMFDPSNPPRMELQGPQQLAYPPGPDLDLAKLSLDTDQMSVGSHNSTTSAGTAPLMPPWVVPASVSRMPPGPAAAHPPYILVNPMSQLPIPHYIPYLSQPAPAAPPLPPPAASPAPPRPLLFSLHRSPPHSLLLYLQHCPSLLTRAQLTSFLDSFLGPAAPQLHGGQWQFLDTNGVWCALEGLPEGTPVTNRFPIQIYFEGEEQAGPTVSALRQVGFLQLEGQHE